MKIKNKGKVYPSPSSSSSSSNGDSLSVLKLLPAAILALTSVLSLEDREVLAYLITRSIKATATAASSSSSSSSSASSIIQRKTSKNKHANGSVSGVISNTHKPPVFDCDCFDCYTSYWFRWDSSPNRELIHQAIEAFEDHLTNGESEKSKKNGKAKRRDKTARRFPEKNRNQLVVVEETEESSSVAAAVAAEAETLPENDVAVAPVSSHEKDAKRLEDENEVAADVSGESASPEVETPAATAAASSSSHAGLARKVLPDVLGLFNSRLWSLWSPNA